jgi:transaldolase
MKLFLDTADTAEIKYFADIGLLDGVTTNPSLLAGKDYINVLKEICIFAGYRHVSAEVIATDYESMIQEGLALRGIADNIVVKLPLTLDGIRACNYFALKGVPTNVTLCFSATQALIAAKAGATYVSIFVGRLDDIGENGMHVVSEAMDIYRQYPDISSQLIVASVRSTAHVSQAAQLGVSVCTIPPKVMKQLFTHPLTDQGLEKFLSDWNRGRK